MEQEKEVNSGKVLEGPLKERGKGAEEKKGRGTGLCNNYALGAVVLSTMRG